MRIGVKVRDADRHAPSGACLVDRYRVRYRVRPSDARNRCLVARRARARGESAHEGACESDKSEFPSERQASCAGLRREFYPAYIRELLDFDYDEKLPEEA